MGQRIQGRVPDPCGCNVIVYHAGQSTSEIKEWCKLAYLGGLTHMRNTSMGSITTLLILTLMRWPFLSQQESH